jgi:hypothetical protein
VIAGAAEAPVSAVALLGMICNSTGVMGLSFGIDAGYTNGWGLNGWGLNGWGLNGWGLGASTGLLAVRTNGTGGFNLGIRVRCATCATGVTSMSAISIVCCSGHSAATGAAVAIATNGSTVSMSIG